MIYLVHFIVNDGKNVCTNRINNKFNSEQLKSTHVIQFQTLDIEKTNQRSDNTTDQ